MEIAAKRSFIQHKARESEDDSLGVSVLWSRHAVSEMIEDQLTRTEVERALQQCDVIEDYDPTHRALPDCLVLGLTPAGEPVHAVIALDVDAERIFIVTVYRPAEEEWKDDWRTRRN